MHFILPQRHKQLLQNTAIHNSQCRTSTRVHSFLQLQKRIQQSISKDVGVLQTVQSEGVNAVLWERDFTTKKQRQLEAIVAAAGPFRQQVVIESQHIPQQVAALFPSTHRQLKAALQHDVEQVVTAYLDVMEYERVLVRLETVAKTTCSRWHADHVPVRGLVTYFGPGTLFVSNEHVDRKELLRTLGMNDTKGFAVKRPSAVQQAAAGDVLLLKGEAYPGMEGLGVVHRSPDGASANSPRLLLTLDKVHEDGCC